MKHSIITLFLLVSIRIAMAQHMVGLGTFTDFGVPINSYSQGKEVLKGKGFNFQSNWGLCFQYRAFNRVGIELGISQNYARWRMKDKSFEARNNGYKAVTTNHNYYWGYYAALQLFQPLSKESSVYLGGGVTFNSIGNYSNSITKNFFVERDNGFINEDVTSSVTYKPSNLGYFGEIGIMQKIGDRTSVAFGIKGNFGQSIMSQGNYQVFDVSSQVVQSTDKFTSFGSYMGFNIKLTYHLIDTKKKEKTPIVKPQPVVKEDPNKNKNPQTKPQQPKPKPAPSKVEGRTVKVTQKITVHNKTVRVQVWDHQEVDGDRISLKLDEMWIMQNYTLTEKKKEVVITLKPGSNYFTLHALNLGKLSPNTAAMNIIDGTQEHKIVLESTLTQSGTIEIVYVP